VRISKEPAPSPNTDEGKKVKFVDINSPKPRRKRKPKASPLDNYEPYQKLRHMILNGKFLPFQEAGVLLDQKDAAALDEKHPWRTVAERLRKLVKELGLESEYEIKKYETDTAGLWIVMVRYTPPLPGSQPKTQGRRATAPLPAHIAESKRQVEEYKKGKTPKERHTTPA
jgi:hypothetical protein